MLLLLCGLSAGFDVNAQTMINIAADMFILGNVSFHPHSTLTLTLDANVTKCVAFIHTLVVSPSSIFISPASITVVISEIVGQDSSSGEFVFAGAATYFLKTDVRMDLPNTIRFTESATFRLSQFEDSRIINRFTFPVGTLKTHGRWTIPRFIFPKGVPVHLVIAADFLDVANQAEISRLVSSGEMLGTICSSGAARDWFRLEFEGSEWAFKWESAFARVQIGENCVGVRITEPLYETIHCLQGVDVLCPFPADNVSGLFDQSWMRKLPAPLRDLTVVLTDRGATLNFNGLPVSAIHLQVIGIAMITSPRTQLIYEPGVTDARIDSLYVENVDFSIGSLATAEIRPRIRKLVLAKKCQFTDRTFLRANWSLVSSLHYDASLLAQNDLYLIPGARVSNREALSLVVTDLEGFRFVFESEAFELSYSLETVVGPLFPFSLAERPLRVVYRDNVSRKGVHLNVSVLIVDQTFRHCHQGAEVTFSARSLTLVGESQVLPFNFENVEKLEVFATTVDAFDFLGKFSICAGAKFTSPAGTSQDIRFWREFLIGVSASASLNRMTFWGPMFLLSGATIHLNSCHVAGELHFVVCHNARPAIVYVDQASDFGPDALYIDIEAEALPLLNETPPLVCGWFDCHYLLARGRFAIVDEVAGFYLVKGECMARGNASCYVLTALYTPNTTMGMDVTTVTMIISIVGIVGIAILASVTFAVCVVHKRRERDGATGMLAAEGAFADQE
jgi:hypothetical protein